MRTGRYCIKDLLNSKEIDQIIIPEIQRDYVWSEKNVLGLLNSIYSNFKERKSLKLNIQIVDSTQSIEHDMHTFLTEEYNKLHFNTRIGFIYAYHNPEYVGKYFLIDGQQRLTTIFLLLLASYKILGLQNQFRELYFKNNEPKIDYQVRETSHDFMIDFLDSELDSNKPETSVFDLDSRFYDIYKKDQTAKTLLKNYKIILSFITTNIKTEHNKYLITDWIGYLENYIEFNYFDTNMSDQGERLYLYMNSRGESLSDHELVKSELIGRSLDKLSAGKLWEDWQNFFWKNRGDNHNADKGFLEFLKWAVILHMDKNPESIKKPLEKKSGDKDQSEIERKEDYIKQTNPEEQAIWIRQYILANVNFDISWLHQLMEAVKRLHLFRSEDKTYEAIPEKWLCNVKNAADYSPICGCLQYLINNPNVDDLNLLRLSMYIKNLCSGFNNRRNPDNTVLRVLKLIAHMEVNRIIDIRMLTKDNCRIDDENVFRINDLRFNFWNKNEEAAHEWEKFFWSITCNNELNVFLRGNHNFIIKLFGEKPTINEAYRYKDLFTEKIFEKRSDKELRKELLKYGDISIKDGGGSNNLSTGEWMQRWNLLINDRDAHFWNNFFYQNSDIEDNSGQENKTYPKSVAIVRSLLDNNSSNEINEDLNHALIEAVDYMEQYKYLWYNNGQKPHCILLKGHQASTSKACELPVYLLHKRINGSWISNHKCCVINFDVADNGYFMCLSYHWHAEGGSWYCRIGHKDQTTDRLLSDIISKVDHKVYSISWNDVYNSSQNLDTHTPIYKENTKDTFLGSANEVAKYVEGLREKLETEIIQHTNKN